MGPAGCALFVRGEHPRGGARGGGALCRQDPEGSEGSGSSGRDDRVMPLVAAIACPHTPQLLVRPETEDRELVLRVHAAYARVKQLLTEARTDAICVIGGDHIE